MICKDCGMPIDTDRGQVPMGKVKGVYIEAHAWRSDCIWALKKRIEYLEVHLGIPPGASIEAEVETNDG